MKIFFIVLLEVLVFVFKELDSEHFESFNCLEKLHFRQHFTWVMTDNHLKEFMIFYFIMNYNHFVNIINYSLFDAKYISSINNFVFKVLKKIKNYFQTKCFHY